MLRTLFCICMFLVVVMPSQVFAQENDKQAQIGKLERQIEIYQAALKNTDDPEEIADLEKKIAKAKAKIAEFRGDNPGTDLSTQIIELKKIINKLEKENNKLKNDIKQLQDEIKQLKQASQGWTYIQLGLSEHQNVPASIPDVTNLNLIQMGTNSQEFDNTTHMFQAKNSGLYLISGVIGCEYWTKQDGQPGQSDIYLHLRKIDSTGKVTTVAFAYLNRPDIGKFYIDDLVINPVLQLNGGDKLYLCLTHATQKDLILMASGTYNITYLYITRLR